MNRKVKPLEVGDGFEQLRVYAQLSDGRYVVRHNSEHASELELLKSEELGVAVGKCLVQAAGFKAAPNLTPLEEIKAHLAESAARLEKLNNPVLTGVLAKTLAARGWPLPEKPFDPFDL